MVGKLIVLGGVLLPAIASAQPQQKFGELADKAVKLGSAADVAALFWTLTVDCDKASGGDDMARRQCELVKADRAAKNAGRLYLIEAEPGSFWVGEWDAKQKGASIGVRGCIACGEAPVIGGERRYLTTKGEVAVKGGALIGPDVHRVLRKFKDEAEARRYREVVAPRVRTQLVFKMPERATPWTEGGAKGFAVELVAFRAWDPCDGAMICSNPPSDEEKADRAMCQGGDASGTEVEGEGEGEGEKKPPEEVKPKEPELPQKLSAAEVQRAMKRASADVNACYATYGVPGKADLMIEIGGDGKVRKVTLKGEFEDTPTGACIVEAVQKTEFPKFKADSMTVKYPFILR